MAKSLLMQASLLTLTVTVLVEGRRSNFCADKTAAMYADPDNCGGFYQCFMAFTFYHNCPLGLFFNNAYSVCDWPGNVNCQQQSSTSPTSSDPAASDSTTLPSTVPTTTSPKPTACPVLPFETPERTDAMSTVTVPPHETPKSTPAPLDITVPEKARFTPKTTSATFCLNKPDDLYADPVNCDGFYQCSRSYTYHFTCQLDLLFNPDLKYCDWEWNVNCSAPRDYRYRSQQNVNDEDNRTTMPLLDTEIVNNTIVNSTLAAKCGKVVCYYPNWAVNRQGLGAKFGPEDINPELCTHIIYAFSTLRGNRLVALDSADEARGSDIGNFARVTNLKLRNPDLKVLLAVGGWNIALSLFSTMAANEESRAEFISTTIEFLRSRKFDGLDIDWEYPGVGDDREINKERYTRLCEELHLAFDKEASGENRLILAGAVAAGKSNIDASYNVPRLAAAFDFINVMSYDLHGSWERRTGHISPLKAGSWEVNAEAYLNIEWVANYWISLGAPKNKLVIGVSMYARTFTLTSISNTWVGASSLGPGLPGMYTAESGYLSYYEVCTMFNHSTKYFIPEQRVPYLVSGNQWVGYDDSSSIREKVQFITDSGFGGIMVWDLSQDDFRGRFCGEGNYPLMNAIISQCASRQE